MLGVKNGQIFTPKHLSGKKLDSDKKLLLGVENRKHVLRDISLG